MLALENKRIIFNSPDNLNTDMAQNRPSRKLMRVEKSLNNLQKLPLFSLSSVKDHNLPKVKYFTHNIFFPVLEGTEMFTFS